MGGGQVEESADTTGQKKTISILHDSWSPFLKYPLQTNRFQVQRRPRPQEQGWRADTRALPSRPRRSGRGAGPNDTGGAGRLRRRDPGLLRLRWHQGAWSSRGFALTVRRGLAHRPSALACEEDFPGPRPGCEPCCCRVSESLMKVTAGWNAEAGPDPALVRGAVEESFSVFLVSSGRPSLTADSHLGRCTAALVGLCPPSSSEEKMGPLVVRHRPWPHH